MTFRTVAVGPLCLLLWTALFAFAFAPSRAPGDARVTDLRSIEPIHGDPAAGGQKATACFACHGAGGASIAPIFPRLAGQRADYLYHRLVAFKHAAPKDPYYAQSPMTSQVARLGDQDMRDLAVFFAAQAPSGSDVSASDASGGRGSKLFLSGDPARGVPPCQGCHGADASGPPSQQAQYAAYPSLRGQYAPYISARLTNFRAGSPHDTSNALIMGDVAHNLDDGSIQAVAAWLSSLQPMQR
jgi:cytochrome c553